MRNSDSQGNSDSQRSITVTIRPQFDARTLDPGSFTLQAIDLRSGEPTSRPMTADGRRGVANASTLVLTFDREALDALGGPEESLALRVLGKTKSGLYVSGTTFDAMPSSGQHGQHGGSGQHGHHSPTSEEE